MEGRGENLYKLDRHDHLLPHSFHQYYYDDFLRRGCEEYDDDDDDDY